MKKNTMTALYTALTSGILPENAAEIAAEIKSELDKNAAKAQKNREIYDAARPVCLRVLADQTVPVGAKELFAEIPADELPEGFTASKLTYALNNYWTDAVVKTEEGYAIKA